MAEGKQPSLQDLEKLSQDIISRFESALNVSTTSELTSMVDDINKSLDTQANLIQNIKVNSTDRLKHVTDESTKVKETTAEIQKQAKLYGDILTHNDDISENWDKMIKQSAILGKNYDDINKKQKQYLTSLNVATKKEKKLSDQTFKRMKAVAVNAKKTAKSTKSGGRMPQFVNTQGIASNQLTLESLTGGKPYFASHPEMGVPLGLFNTKDEPTRGSRIRAIEKYGPAGSIGGIFPQYASDLESQLAKGSDDDEGNLSDLGAVASSKFILKVLEKKAGPLMDSINEIIGIVNDFADKLQDFAGEADDAIRSAVQAAGTIMDYKWAEGKSPLTRADYFSQSMTKAAQELNIDEGVFASFQMLADLQKSFTEYSKTNVLLGKEDLKQMLYLQQTFDLAANDVGEIKGAFMDLGMSTQDMMDYSTDLARNAKNYGVSASKLLKDTAKLMKLGAAYRFKGGVKDMEKMQVYAANAHFDIEKAYTVMDKSMSIEGAVDLASQLQVLGGAFSDISSLDLFAAAQSGDVQGFTNQIIGRFRQDAGRFGAIDETGMFKFNRQGNLLLKAFKNIEGFDLGDDIANVVQKAGKEGEIRRKILGGINRDAFMKRSADEQNTIVQNLAQGSVSGLNIAGQDLVSDVVDFDKMVFDKAADDILKLGIGPGTAKGAQSVKDELDLNQQIIAMQSQTTTAMNSVKTGLDKMKDTLLMVGDSVRSIGLATFKDPLFRKMQIMQQYLGLSAEEAYLFNGWFSDMKKGQNDFAGLMKGLMKVVNEPFSLVDNSESRTAADKLGWSSPTKLSFEVIDAFKESPTPKMRGGILQAAGGMVMGNSHFAGGVRGTGRFNNVEVEGGEAIINKKSTQAFLPLLSKLNEIGGGQAFVTGGGRVDFKDAPDNKTLNIKLQGRFDYVSNISNTTADLYELAQELQEITSGKGYGDAR